jgi:cytochrome c oxidase cbb3-type subunit 3
MEPARVTRFRARITPGLLALSVAWAVVACKPQGAEPVPLPALPAEGQLATLPLGDIAGSGKVRALNEISNPLANDAGSIAEGHRLFIAMNCAGCHGYEAKGNMGPNLTDAYWRYGGTPAAIYNSIYAGRPQGMPSWGRALPAQDIWKIVAYLQTLGGAIAATQYHAGLQGDHGLTSSAEAADGSLGASASPIGIATPSDSDPTAPPAPSPATQPP